MSGHAIAFLGASGRIGTLLRAAERLSPQENRRYIWQFRTDHPQAPENHFVWSEFSDPAPFINVATQHRVHTLCVFTGATANKAALAPEAQARTREETLATVEHALHAAQRAGISRVLVASSSAIYGMCRDAPFSEADMPAPHTGYGQTKLAVEQLCARWREASSLEICALRIGNVAGADALLGAAAHTSARDLDIFPDGDGPRRSYLGPTRLFEILTALADHEGNLPSVLNLGGHMPVSMNALLESAKLPWHPRPCTLAGHQKIVLNSDRLAALCPAIDLHQDAEAIVADWQATLNSAGA